MSEKLSKESQYSLTPPSSAKAGGWGGEGCDSIGVEEMAGKTKAWSMN